jgi:hypothetical protein
LRYSIAPCHSVSSENRGSCDGGNCTFKSSIMSSGNFVERMPASDGQMYHIQCDDLRPAVISASACWNVGQGALELNQRPDWQHSTRSIKSLAREALLEGASTGTKESVPLIDMQPSTEIGRSARTEWHTNGQLGPLAQIC